MLWTLILLFWANLTFADPTSGIDPNCLRSSELIAKASFDAELTGEIKPSPHFEADLAAVLDRRLPPVNVWQRKVSALLDQHYQSVDNSPGKTDGEAGTAISAYWTMNAISKVVSLTSCSAEKKALAFERLGDLIRKRTSGWHSPWQMQPFRNHRGDFIFFGATHSLVILNEPRARVLKGLRPQRNRVSGEFLGFSPRQISEWDPRTEINHDLFVAKPENSISN